MSIANTLNQIHLKARQNKWLWAFAIFNRIMLALGFLPSGFVKVNGERFTDLHNDQPMGSYLEAFFHTGYYYTFVGILQMTAAVLLLIPRTTTLGALIYFPIILNICILSYAVRFDGSLLTAPLMVLANLYLLCWDYHKLKYIFPFNSPPVQMPKWKELNTRFPIKYFLGVITAVALVIIIINTMYSNIFMPRNTMEVCEKNCNKSEDPESCLELCNCVHIKGESLKNCLKMHE